MTTQWVKPAGIEREGALGERCSLLKSGKTARQVRQFADGHGHLSAPAIRHEKPGLDFQTGHAKEFSEQRTLYFDGRELLIAITEGGVLRLLDFGLKAAARQKIGEERADAVGQRGAIQP